MLNKKTIFIIALTIGCTVGIALGSILGFHYFHIGQPSSVPREIRATGGINLIGINFNHQLKLLITAILAVILYIFLSIIISKQLNKK